MIEKHLLENGDDKLRRADLIKDLNAGKSGAGFFMKEEGNKDLKIGRVVTTGFNYAYDNNFLSLQDGLDWVGQKTEKMGDAVVGYF